VYVGDTPDAPLFSEMIVTPVLRYLAFETPNPDFALGDLKFTEATLRALPPRHPLFDATNADLSAFHARGGKLILWHGLADPHISPASTVSLHER
jgi:feruloyl esterase